MTLGDLDMAIINDIYFSDHMLPSEVLEKVLEAQKRGEISAGATKEDIIEHIEYLELNR